MKKTYNLATNRTINGAKYMSGTETKAATCTEKGTKICTCKRCDKTEEKEIPALGHIRYIDLR